MTRPDPSRSGRARLAADAQAWLPANDPRTRDAILGLLARVAGAGDTEPIAALRDAVTRWFGPDAAVALPPPRPPRQVRPVASVEAITLEPLVPLRCPTMWPQRPKRLPDELFSSWLRHAAVAAGTAPREFAIDVLGDRYRDADRTVSPTALHRLALLTGQRRDHLAAGTLRLDVDVVQDTLAGMAEDALLRHGRLLLVAPAAHGASAEPGRAVVQYCPRCLGEGIRRPCIRRGWCFAHAVACPTHGCRLHDRCWRCGAAVELLEQRSAAVQPLCAGCDAVLAGAPAVAAGRACRLQRRLDTMLAYIATHLPAAKRTCHLDALATRFAGAIAAPVADRERVVADLLPTTARSWFASPVDPRHEAPLLMLAEGVRYARLEVRSEKRRHRNRQERRGSSGGSGTQGLEGGPGALSLRSPALLRGVGDREMDVQPGPTLPHGR